MPPLAVSAKLPRNCAPKAPTPAAASVVGAGTANEGGDEAQVARRTGEPARGITRGGRAAEGTAADVTRREVGAGEARDAEILTVIAGDVAADVTRAGIEVEPVDRLGRTIITLGIEEIEA